MRKKTQGGSVVHSLGSSPSCVAGFCSGHSIIRYGALTDGAEWVVNLLITGRSVSLHLGVVQAKVLTSSQFMEAKHYQSLVKWLSF